MSDIILFTTNFDGVDTIKPMPRQPGVDTCCITNNPTALTAPSGAAATWTYVVPPTDSPVGDNGRLVARYFKTQMHRLPQAKPYRWLAWADASLRFKDLAFVIDEVRKLEVLPPDQRLLLVPHSERSTLRQEYDFIIDGIEAGNKYLSDRYSADLLRRQKEFFASEGLSIDSQLSALGFLIVENSERFAECWDEWWRHILQFGLMDQITITPLLEQFGLHPQALNVNIWKNEHFEFVVHAADALDQPNEWHARELSAQRHARELAEATLRDSETARLGVEAAQRNAEAALREAVVTIGDAKATLELRDKEVLQFSAAFTA